MSEQARYQVRFDWGEAGARAIGEDADVLVHVDAVAGTGPDDLLAGDGAIIRSDFRTAAAAARWIAQLQHDLRRRLTIAVVGAGAVRSDGSLRTAVEDLLAAGALIDALGAEGIDATSPEAAAAEAAYRGLGRAVRHLVTASVTATTETVSPATARIDTDLAARDVVVVRPHPEA